MSYVTIGSISDDGTEYVVYGNMEHNAGVVCCVNGLGSHMIFYYKIRDLLLLNDFCVIQYNLIGRGRSVRHRTGNFGEDEHVEQLHHLLTSTLAVPTRVHLFGHSMGGSLVTLYTARYPDSVQSLTLMCPAGLMNPEPISYLRSWPFLATLARWISEPLWIQESGWRRAFYNHTGIYKEREEEMVRAMHHNTALNPSAFDAIWSCVLQFPLYGIDEKVKAVSQLEHLHVFLMWGENDVDVPYSPCFNRWSDILSNGKAKFSSKVLKSAGHAFMLEHPEETNESILEFLKSVH